MVLIAAATLILLLPVAPSLQAQGANLIANGTFNSTTAGWTSSAASDAIQWSSLDANGSNSSGSGLVSAGASAANQVASITQCVAVSASTTYYLTGKSRTPSGQGRTGSAALATFLYPQPGCAGTAAGTVQVNAQNVSDAWSTFPLGNLVSSAGSVSAKVVLSVSKVEAGGQFQAYFDDVAFFAGSPATLTIPASASIHGNNASFFHTDLWTMNRSYTQTQTITARYRCFPGQSCSTASKSFTLAPRASILYEDVVGTFFGSPETAGAIELSYDTIFGNVSATSRVYTPSQPAPTSGSTVPALAASEARTRTLFLGLGSFGGDLSSGFRSNAGAYNPNAFPVPVTFTLYNGNNTILGSPLSRNWGPNEAFQISNIFAAAGLGSAVTTNAYLVVTAPSPIFAYVTVIDNQSGDSVYATPNPDESAP